MTTGAGAPSTSCTAPSSSNLALYTDTTNQDIWECVATNIWKKVLAVSGSGTYVATGATGTSPGSPSAGYVSCYYDSTANTELCLDSSGNVYAAVKTASSRTANQFITYINASGVPQTAAIAAADLPGMVGDSGSGGTKGAAPAPGAGDAAAGKFLKADATWGVPSGSGSTATIAYGALALATSSISSGACQTVSAGSVNSATASGVATTDAVQFTPSASIKAATGYIPSTSGGLTITAYPTSGYVNFDVCNWSAGAIVPGAVTLNWRVVR
jgi:hypothetical protein